MQKMITFVVPSYNSQEYLHICVNSLLKGGDDVEILIVNDGSTDRTAEIGRKYEKKYPGIVRLLEQENGGHGEGINHGLREARGIFFKVVDSDDWVDEKALKNVLKWLKHWEKNGEFADLLVTNYVYVNRTKRKRRVIRFQHPLPRNRVMTWEETRGFLVWQNLTLHSCIFRTSTLRDSKVELPKHVFYEDNYFVYKPLPYVEKLAYLDENFYQYLIGREGQSVAEEALKKRCDHQVRISKLCFEAYHVPQYRKKNRRLGKYMHHEICLMMTLGSVFPRLNDEEKYEEMVRQMWKDAFAFDFWYAFRVRYLTYVVLLNLPGKVGRKIARALYRASNLAVPFN